MRLQVATVALEGRRALAQADPFGLWPILSRFRCFIGGGTQLGLPNVSRESRPKRTYQRT